jgi:hypothetical protein
MSWLYSQALVAASLGENSLAGEPYAPSNGTPTPQAFLCSDKTTAAWTRFPSGMTCKPLTADHGEALLMSYRAGFHAPTYPPPAAAPGSTEKPAPCGTTWRESSVKFDPATSSWKTHRCLFDEDLPESSVILPRWGMTQDGVCWERTTQEHLTSAIEYGSSVPTPTAGDAKSSGSRNTPNSKAHAGISLTDYVKKDGGKGRMWPTPDVRGFTNDGSLQMLAKMCTDRTEWSRMAFRKGAGGKQKIWPTPTCQDAANNGGKSQQQRHTKPLNAEVGGALSPMWVEWLMGWPLEWTAFAASATDKFQQWSASHGISSARPLPTDS